MHLHHLAAIERWNPEAIFVPMIVFGFVLLIIFIAHYFRLQRDRLWHETARAALEKGQPLPGQALSPGYRCRSPWRDFRGGLILLAVGIAFLCAHVGPPGIHGNFPGVILTGIGVAFLLSALFQGVFSSKDRDDGPPSGLS